MSPLITLVWHPSHRIESLLLLLLLRNSPLHGYLPSFQYLPIDKVPNRKTAARIKRAVLRLLDRFAHNAPQLARKEGYIKIATMPKYTADSRTFLMACIVVASTDTDYNDRLGWLPSLPFLMPSTYLCSTLQLICTLPLTSFSRRPPYLRVKEIASTVDESFSKPQEEFLLCQQLTAIQRRELSALQRGVNDSTPLSRVPWVKLTQINQHE